MTNTVPIVFRNLPPAACWQWTALYLHSKDGYMLGGPLDPEAGECPRMRGYPAASAFSYAVRACSPYSPCGPAAGSQTCGAPEESQNCCACQRPLCRATWNAYYDWARVQVEGRRPSSPTTKAVAGARRGRGSKRSRRGSRRRVFGL